MEFRLGRHEFGPDELVVMAIVNRTPDSFYDRGATFAEDAALAAVARAVDEGARIVDIGGVKAAPGDDVDVAEEIRRTVSLVAAVRARHPQVAISVDTWRAPVGEAVCEAGADLLNDTWAGADPELVHVAARHGVGLVCTHAGRLTPRTRPHRPTFDDVTADAVAVLARLAERAVAAGVARESVLVDVGCDMGKNTRQSLELVRRLDEIVACGWPVLASLSRKDFVGETLDLPVDERLLGTLATTSVAAWHGAQVFRAHDVAPTRQTLDMVASIRGTREPASCVRGLA